LNHDATNQIKPNQTKSNQIKPNQTEPNKFYWVLFTQIIKSSGRTKQFAQVVCEKREFNFVLVHVVEYADVFADDGDGAILHGLIEQVRVLDVAEVVVQNVHDGIALIVQLIQMRNALGDGLSGA